MDSFGEYLKRERKLRGVSLDEIAKASKISKTFLKSLESDDFENLPSEVFVKGFIRCYAENIGMDCNEATLAYSSFIADKRISQAGSDFQTETSTKSNMKMSYFLLILILVAVSSLMVFYPVEKKGEIKPSFSLEDKFSQRAGEIHVEESKSDIGIVPGSNITETKALIKSDDIQSKPEEEGIVDEIDVEESKNNIGIALDSNAIEVKNLIQSEDMEAQVAEKDISNNLFSPPPTGNEETSKVSNKKEVTDVLTLFMEAKEDAWISLTIDDAEVKEALLSPGETAKWEAKEKFVVTLGNATGTHLKLNEKDITLPKTSSNVLKNFSITLDNIN